MAGIPIGRETAYRVVKRRFPFVTLLLIIVNVLVYIAILVDPSIILPYASSPEIVYRELGVVPISIVRGERMWTLFTSMFLHGDIYHLFGNMLFLYFFGAPVENAMGGKRFLLFYFLAGLTAHFFHIASITIVPQKYLLTHYISSPWATPSIGASGAISGVMGAYLIYYPRSRITLLYFITIIPLFIPLPAWAYILLWFLTQLAMGLLVITGLAYSSIAFWAHIGGFIAGIAFSPFFLHPHVKEWIKARRIAREYGVAIPT